MISSENKVNGEEMSRNVEGQHNSRLLLGSQKRYFCYKLKTRSSGKK
jgi:hypothetical protein